MLLQRHRYLYADLDHNDAAKAFRSDFMVRLLATAYLPSINGHLSVPSWDCPRLSRSGVKGVLGLCGAAVIISFGISQR